jgi:ubiquinone/menaquinone biosynthesis C-methylase UbiE
MFNNQPIKSKDYEKNKWPYYLSLPLMWFLTIYVMFKKQVYKLLGLPKPKINTFFFDGIGLACRKVKEYATTWKAMEIIYNHIFPKKLLLWGALDEFYWRGMNCQALRNRYKLVKKEIYKAISEFPNEKEIKIISLASGAGQALIEVVAEFKKKGIFIRSKLVDFDANALEHAKNIAKQYGVEDRIEYSQKDIDGNEDYFKNFNPNIVEMLGFLDYADQEKAINFVKKIYNILPNNGILITCNIAPNIEQYFLKWVIDWPMVYRKEKDLSEIAKKSGFNNYRVVYEPMKIHGLLIAKK